MDQQISNELPPLHNPEQAVQIDYNSVETAPGIEQTEVQANVATERGSTAQQPLPPVATQAPMGAPVATAAGAAALANMPTIADDTDLIEKEWVLKAKEIVARTKHDPYLQNKEVERVKADYLKKRYNKDIKVTED